MKLSLARILFVSLLSPPALVAAPTGAMDIETVQVIVDATRFDGVLDPLPYSFQASVEGTGIGSITLQTPSGASHSLILTGSEWLIGFGGFPSLASIGSSPSIGFGDFTFTFFGQAGELETTTVSYLPGGTDPHSGFGSPTNPTHAQTDVSLLPTFTWTCSSPPCGNYAWYLEVFPESGPGASYDDNILDPSILQWTPPGLLSGSTFYAFWLWAGTILGGSPQTGSTSPSGDLFVYAPGFETLNVIQFTTIEDCFASASFRTAGANPGSYSATPPVLGSMFTGTVDLTSTGHSLAVLVGFASPLNLTLAGGQVVLVNFTDPSGELLQLGSQSGPLATFQLTVPTDLSFCGLGLSTQAIHIGGVQPFALSNAQDLVIGF